MRAWTLALLATLLAAGCAAPSEQTPGATTGAAAQRVEAPWWPEGAWWDVTIEGSRVPTQTVRLVHFWNDSATHHFWLGVDDRGYALEHAIHDVNPLLGRIHWGLLTPHEKGIHAQGLYTFPAEAGDTFEGMAFGTTWTIDAKAGDKTGGLLFEGRSGDGSTLRYDYDPGIQWFSFIEVKDGSGTPALVVQVTDHGQGATGQYYFLRGRDYYEGPNGDGTREESFVVEQEDIAHKSLAVQVTGTASSVLRLDFIAPNGESKHSETLPGGSVDRILEIPNPQTGTWKIRYVGTGTFEGVIEATGILEYSKTL